MRHVFAIVPASSGPLWFVAVLALVMIALLSLSGYIAYSSRNAEFALSPEGLEITGDIYGRAIPAASLVVEQVRAMDLTGESSYALKRRTNGIGLPGLWIGWFRGGGGRYKLYLTDRTSVLYIPTTEGYDILFSTRQGERIMEEIREKARAAR